MVYLWRRRKRRLPGGDCMPADMKETIAEAARKLLTEDKVKKLTVKDIVEECHITRQTFYYHFEDIPHMLEWIMERESEKLRENFPDTSMNEDNFRYFFRLALNALPHVKKAMESNYAQELEILIDRQIQLMFRQMVEEHKLYQGLSEEELEIVRRYHSRAILGILREWSVKDEKNADTIIHTMYRMLQGEITP